MTKPKNTHRKNDIMLITFFLIISVVIAVVYIFFFRKEGAYVEITVNGVLYQTVPLDQDTSIDIKTSNNGLNRLVIEDGYAYISVTNCPDKLCSKQKKIHYHGEKLVCLPHKVVVTVISSQEISFDSIAS